MKVTTEKLPDSQVVLTIEVEPERVVKAVEQAYRTIAGRINIPGFRPGKAPRHMVERLVGREAVVAEGIERLIPKAYDEAVKEAGITPIDQPKLDVEPNLETATTAPLIFKATVPVQPVATLGDYKTIRLAPVPVDVTPEMVDRTIDGLRENAAAWTPIERAIQAGDQATIDLEGRVGTAPVFYGADGKPIISTSGGEVVIDQKNITVRVDPEKGFPVPAVHKEMVGLTAGGEKAFQASLPAEYPDPTLASKNVTFSVKVHEVKEQSKPELDDEFAKTLGEYQTVDELRAAVEKSLRERLEHDSRHHYEDSLVTEAVKTATVELPPVVVEREVDRLVKNFGNNLRQQRVGLEQYLRLVQKSEADLREEMRPQAIDNLKAFLVLREVGKAEGIEVSDADVDAEIERVTGPLDEKVAGQLRQALARETERDDIRQNLYTRRVIERLDSYAQATTAAAGGMDEIMRQAHGAEPAAGDTAAEPAAGSEPNAEGGEWKDLKV